MCTTLCVISVRRFEPSFHHLLRSVASHVPPASLSVPRARSQPRRPAPGLAIMMLAIACRLLLDLQREGNGASSRASCTPSRSARLIQPYAWPPQPHLSSLSCIMVRTPASFLLVQHFPTLPPHSPPSSLSVGLNGIATCLHLPILSLCTTNAGDISGYMRVRALVRPTTVLRSCVM